MGNYPIIMTGESVRATRDGRKTVTRRIPSTTNSLLDGYRVGGRGALREVWDGLDWRTASIHTGLLATGYFQVLRPGTDTAHRIYPLYEPGDTLWLRETWGVRGWMSDPAPIVGDHPEGLRLCVEYQADEETGRRYFPDDGDYPRIRLLVRSYEDETRWRSPIHMPRWASRLTLEVKAVRAERLQDITFVEVEAEGLDALGTLPVVLPWRLSEKRLGEVADLVARVRFAKHWDEINAKRGYPWKDNPPVWAIEYRLAGSDNAAPDRD